MPTVGTYFKPSVALGLYLVPQVDQRISKQSQLRLDLSIRLFRVDTWRGIKGRSVSPTAVMVSRNRTSRQFSKHSSVTGQQSTKEAKPHDSRMCEIRGARLGGPTYDRGSIANIKPVLMQIWGWGVSCSESAIPMSLCKLDARHKSCKHKR